MAELSERDVRLALKELDTGAEALYGADMGSFQDALGALMHALNEPPTREALRDLPTI